MKPAVPAAPRDLAPMIDTPITLFIYPVRYNTGVIGDSKLAIGARLKQARSQNELTQVQLARKTRASLRTIRRIEQTDFEPRLATARKLATALDVRVEWLVFGIEPMTVTAATKEKQG
jgi:DNA-binding XRE family transcriptional regulator